MVCEIDYEMMWKVECERNQKLQAELKATKEQLDIAEAVLSVQCTESAIRYFEDKQKDEVKGE